jgi:two-component system, NtrC family, response regulator AtoC
VDARIICATNKILQKLVHEGKFREDLYYRINTITLRVPSLRERQDDILPLAEHFLAHFSGTIGKRIVGFTDEARRMLRGYPWPGNVRELRNVVERAVVLSGTESISPENLPRELACSTGETSSSENRLEEMEKRVLVEVLGRSRGNISSAARELGISRDTLRYRIRKYGLSSG